MVVDKYYSIISAGYNELYKEEQVKKINLVKKILKINKNDLLLDIGCGTGISTKPFIKKCKTIGIDTSFEMLKNVKNKCICGEAEYLPFKPNLFDIIISITTFQNFYDINKAIDEILMVSKKDCQIVISIIKKSKKIDNLKRILKNRFEVKEIEEEKDLMFFLKPKIS